MEIEQPQFDELAPALSDVEEVGDAILDQAHYKGIAKLGTTTGTYYASLIEMGVPPKQATHLTIEWMHICEGSGA
jgi:hypothetical protein